MFEDKLLERDTPRFSEKATKAFVRAQEESRRLGHNRVDSEQILLGLIGEDTSIAVKTLGSRGKNFLDLHREVEKIIGQGDGTLSDQIPLTKRAVSIIERAWSEALQLGYNFVSTDHLLLGIIRDKESVAVQCLKNFDVDIEKLQQELMKAIPKQRKI